MIEAEENKISEGFPSKSSGLHATYKKSTSLPFYV